MTAQSPSHSKCRHMHRTRHANHSLSTSTTSNFQKKTPQRHFYGLISSLCSVRTTKILSTFYITLSETVAGVQNLWASMGETSTSIVIFADNRTLSRALGCDMGNDNVGARCTVTSFVARIVSKTERPGLRQAKCPGLRGIFVLIKGAEPSLHISVAYS
jgi:hypothetical protein